MVFFWVPKPRLNYVLLAFVQYIDTMFCLHSMQLLCCAFHSNFENVVCIPLGLVNAPDLVLHDVTETGIGTEEEGSN